MNKIDSRSGALHRLKIARGHLDKVIEMLEKNEYCIDILNQSLAVQSAIKQADAKILENHLSHCVADAFSNNRKDEAIAEVIKVFKKTE